LEFGLSLIFGLLTATGFGTSDFIAKLSTNKVGFLRTALFMQIIGSFLILPFALHDTYLLYLHSEVLLEGVALGVVNALATLSLYKGFEVGRLSIVSPIASSYPVVSVFLAITFLGESLTGERLLGITLVVVGIILVSIQKEQLELRKRVMEGVVYANIYMVLGGVYLPVLLLRWTSACILATVFLAWKPKGAIRLNAFSFIAVIAILDTFANVAYNVGVSYGTVSIVSTVGGLFSPVTVLLAWICLKERLTTHQIIGFLAVAAGVTVLGLVG